MSTLYITDLDGTLLDENAQIPQESKDILCKLIEKGLNFTIATARSPATAIGILEGIPIKLPIILMTGAIVYDVENRKILKTTNLSESATKRISNILEETQQNAMVYSVTDSNLLVYHKELTCELEKKFVAPRLSTPYKKFIKIDNFNTALNNKKAIMFLLCIKDLEKARNFYEKINKIDGIRCYFYSYEYSDEGYLLEIYDEDCSKASALDVVKKYCKADKIVAFGDNINDIPLFNAADESYATENAVKKAKDVATDTIGPNTSGSVAKFIKTHFEGDV